MNKFFLPETLNISVNKATSKKRNALETTTVNAFEPIGVGKALSIRLHSVYVGDLQNGSLNRKQSILVTSRIKDDVTYEIASRAVHQLYKNVKDFETHFPGAGVEGTPLMYYTRAFDSGALMVDIEIKADRFKQQVLDSISLGLKGAAGLPLFTPYAPFMLAGSSLLRVGGNVLSKVMERQPIMTFRFDIFNNIGGLVDSESGLLIGCESSDTHLFKGYDIDRDPLNPNHLYLSKDGEKYKGDKAYIIIGVDGRSVERYEEFSAKFATASILKRFYGETGNTNIEDLQEMLTVYNDFKYLDKIRNTKKKIKSTTDPNIKDELAELLGAYEMNVVNEDIRNLLKGEV